MTSFNERFPEPRLATWQKILYPTAILVAWGLLGQADYNDQRELECANRSNANWHVYHDRESDTCKKELRNGTTQANR